MNKTTYDDLLSNLDNIWQIHDISDLHKTSKIMNLFITQNLGRV